MGYRAWARAGTALLLALSPGLAAYAQTAPSAAAAPAGPASVVPVLNPAAQAALQRAISGPQRIEPARDRWRNPAATLQFFGVRPTDTVIEIWPGQGWYTSILGPYLKQGSGSLIVGHWDASSSNSSVVRQMVDAYRARFVADQGTYGSVSVVPFGPRSGPLGLPNSVDSVLTFRNIHNWMAQGWAEKAFGDFFLVLKPGGILGIEEHRGRTDEPQDPLARDGYVREDYVIQLAREAGFEFIGRSEINANPADTKDHPFGVWTLPPVARTSPIGDRDDPGFNRARYDAIGESDRMTLRFRKPLNAVGAAPGATPRWAPVVINPAPPPPPPVVPRPSPPIVRPPVAPSPVPRVVTAPTPAPAVVTPPTATVSPPLVTTPPRTTTNSEAVAPRRVDPPVAPPPAPRVVVPPTPAPPVTPPAPPVVPPTVSPPPVAVPVAPPPAVAPPTQLPPVPVAPPVLPPPPSASPPPAPTPAVQRPAPPPAGPPVSPAAPAASPPPPPVVATKPPPARPSPPPAAATPRPAAPPTPPRSRPTQSPPPPAATRPAPAAKAPPSRPAASPPASPRPPAAARPAPTPAARPPVAQPKAKAPPPPPARPAARPAPPPPPPPKAKAAPPPPSPNPNKPDWVVPRKRS